MTNEAKVSKREMFEAIKGLAESGALHMVDFNENITDEAVAEFCANEIDLLDKKAAKAAETAAEKKNELDELCEVVKSILGTEPQTADDVFAQVSGEDVTIAKVRARLTKLEKAGIAVKTDVKVDGKSKKAYTLA